MDVTTRLRGFEKSIKRGRSKASVSKRFHAFLKESRSLDIDLRPWLLRINALEMKLGESGLSSEVGLGNKSYQRMRSEAYRSGKRHWNPMKKHKSRKYVRRKSGAKFRRKGRVKYRTLAQEIKAAAKRRGYRIGSLARLKMYAIPKRKTRRRRK